MSDLVRTTSDNLCKLVHWAHSHGTICNLIPSLHPLTCGSYVPAAEPGPHSSSVPVAVRGCGVGHAYHWPLSDHGNGCSANTSQGQQRFIGGCPCNKVTMRASYFSCSKAATETEEFNCHLFDTAGCDSSATDGDGEYEPRPSRKRGGAAGGAVAGKKVKQEATSAEDYDSAANIHTMGQRVTCQALDTHSQITRRQFLSKPPCPPTVVYYAIALTLLLYWYLLLCPDLT